MNLLQIFFIFLVYGLFGAMYNNETSVENTFPTFQAPPVEFATLPTGCGGFFDCTEYVGKVLVNIVLGVVYFVLLVVEILRVLVAIIILIATNAFTGIEGTPAWLNPIILGTFGVAISIIAFKAVRSGDTDSA